ncbi:hypothetical protein G7046_g3186 [Stylonectria norvegica]|nr:hypothetical protein G7046_g3186 [Stylonectria norvegica]
MDAPADGSTNPPASSEHGEFKRLTVEDGTLCTFCHKSNSEATETGQPYRTQRLSELVEASSYCGYCAMWLRSLEASAQDLAADGGESSALMSHPLLQTEFEPEDVHLQYLDLHDWFEGGIERRIAWPYLGTIWATLDLVPASAQWIVNLQPLSVSDQTDTVWDGIKFWLKECSEHSECKLQHDPSWRPTRLLHLDTVAGALKLRLVEGHDIPVGVQYMTLSHCWGDNVPLTLTSDNLQSFMSSIPAGIMPKTYLDACEATQKLDHNYLWIDSLCIIQDDPHDWATEAGRVSNVYGNSFLNIAATAAADATKGLFYSPQERDRDPWLPIWIQRSWGGAKFEGEYLVCEFRDWWKHLDNAPLNRRAWAVPERMLAPRVLHLGLEQVAFECPSMSACERLPYGNLSQIIGQLSSPGRNVKRFISSARGDSRKSMEVVDILTQWNEVVRNFSHGRLTVDTDRMVALGGMVDAFVLAFMRQQKELSDELQQLDIKDGLSSEPKEQPEQALSSQNSEEAPSTSQLFVAGLWRPMLEMQLAWRATSQVQGAQLNGIAPSRTGKRPDSYVSPTWSWCSVMDVLIEPQQANTLDLSFAHVLEVKIQPTPELDPVEIESGLRYCCSPGSYLRLRCSLLPVAGFGKSSIIDFCDHHDRSKTIRLASSKNYWDVSFDEEATQADVVCIVPLFVDMTRVRRPLHGIFLSVHQEDEKDGKQYFKRMGAFVIKEPPDVKTLWDGIRKFNELNPGVDEKRSEKCDWVLRLVEGKGDTSNEYERKDGVLQRMIEIR